MSEPGTPEGDRALRAIPADREAAPRPPPSAGEQRVRARSCLGSFWALLGVLIGGIYLLNPTLGVFELLPDNAPGFGNLDEAGAAAVLIFGLRYLFARRR